MWFTWNPWWWVSGWAGSTFVVAVAFEWLIITFNAIQKRVSLLPVDLARVSGRRANLLLTKHKKQCFVTLCRWCVQSGGSGESCRPLSSSSFGIRRKYSFENKIPKKGGESRRQKMCWKPGEFNFGKIAEGLHQTHEYCKSGVIAQAIKDKKREPPDKNESTHPSY